MIVPSDASTRPLSAIRTPDQRLRVFISSTRRELAEERAVATEAIRALRLSPVLFDMGARTHAAREISRSYVDQSHIFVGIYWQSYGTVPPDMDQSGIEDELTHATALPKLIYLKDPAPDRDPRLEQMLALFREEGTVSYRRFRTPSELRELIQNDLVVMLSERFEEGGAPAPVEDRATRRLPSFVNEFIGRDEQLAELLGLLERSRLLTLTGPGGVGKSRLALEVGVAVAPRFRDGVHLVPLEAVVDPGLVRPTIATVLQVQDAANPFGDPLVQHLRDKEMLLLLDNFEQILPAGPELVALLEQCPGIKALVTSRVVLSVTGETEFPVPVLSTPRNGAKDPEDLRRYAAVRLFEARAKAVNPRFELTRSSAAAVAEISKRLDGLPLALELAAARTRMFPPEALLERLDRRLNILTGGAMDLPERHRALKSTIAWSYDLLSPGEQSFFTHLGVFRGGWTLEAAEGVCSVAAPIDLLDAMQSLVDSSLIRQAQEGAEVRFSMLETMREFAGELLDALPDAEVIKTAHADYFLGLIREAETGLRTSQQPAWLEILETERDNIRAALAWCLSTHRYEEVAQAGWALWLFWWVRGHLVEGRSWMQDLLAAAVDQLSELSRTRASAVLGVMSFWQADFGDAVPRLASALDSFRTLDDSTGIALSQLALGFMEASAGEVSAALPRFDEARERFETAGDPWGLALALNAMCWIAVSTDLDEFSDETFDEAVAMCRRVGIVVDEGMALGNRGRRRLYRGDRESARRDMGDGLEILWSNSIPSATSYLIDSFGELVHAEGDHHLAALLFGGAERIRTTTNFPLLPFMRVRWERFVTAMKSELGEEGFEQAWNEGLGMQTSDVVALALSEA